MPSDPLGPGAAGGQHQHGHGASGTAPALEHRQAVENGKAEIQHDEVEILRIAEKPGVLAVGSALDHIAGGRQRGRDIAGDALVVLHQEQAHQSSSILMTRAVAASTVTSRTRPDGITILSS